MSLVLLAFVAGGCASTDTPVESAAAPDEKAADVETEVVPEPEAAPEPETAVPSGRDALAANAGKAHVLWFWGAH